MGKKPKMPLKKIIATLLILLVLGSGVFLYLKDKRPPVETKFVQEIKEEITKGTPASVRLVEPGNYALTENPTQVYQTFNNCGPATLSMILSFYGVNATQAELGNKMRPWQNQSGDNDDKNVFSYQFIDLARAYGLSGVNRPNGDIELLKRFTANGIPVIVKTWLNVNDDIGHFRVVRGFDEERKVIIQDDSYHGPNRKIPYYDFLSMWQPFNYDYIVIYSKDMEGKVLAIIGEDVTEKTAWENSLARAAKEGPLSPESVYPTFNASVAAYYLGDLKKTVSEFEKVESKLPRRMLWYQIEPILAYQSLKNYDRVFEITSRILENGNRAFSELYLIRGEIYLAQGDKEKARQEFELAVKYNQNLKKAKDALNSVN